MSQSISRSVRRISGPQRCHPHQQLFVRVRALLQENQAAKASSLFIQDIDSRLALKAKPGNRDEPHDEWLWKTAVLFRSYSHPDLALQVFNRLSAHLPVPIKAAVSAVQACSDLVWQHPASRHPHHQGTYDGRPPAGCEVHPPHTQLAHSLLQLTHRYETSRMPSSSSSSTQQLGGLQHHPATEKPAQPIDEGHTRVLEVIMANIIKLGDMDWIVSILRDFYPRYTQQLGAHLYPDSSSSLPSSSTSAEEALDTQPLEPDEIPSGRLVKFLVTGYMVCKDLRRAYGVVTFHRTLLDGRARATSGYWQQRDVTPEVTFLRGISRTTVGSVEMRMRMVARVLRNLGREKGEGQQLETYVLDGLLEMRVRLGAGWGFRCQQQATLAVVRAAVGCQLALFLLHRARPSTFPIPSTAELVHGTAQGQHSISSWIFRPSAATFSLLLLALRAHLRFQTRPIPRAPSPALNDSTIHGSYSQQQQQHDLDVVERRPKKRRPSPGAHRAILAQILAFEDLHRPAACLPGGPLGLLSDEPPPHGRPGCLPTRLELLTAKNVRLLVESLLVARDYVSVWVFLSAGRVSGVALEDVARQVGRARARLASRWLDAPPRDHLDTQDGRDIQILEAQLRECFALDFRALSCPTTRTWADEERAVRTTLAREPARLAAPLFRSHAFSQPTLDFLRNQAAREQLHILSYGLEPAVD
ncbi:hypothetical protein PCANC_13671 [Puccinia coronata f. sp. avenae]|uniref:Uncharacterized protein n=1 Tax=Puccinia coronata f. sp. avenae TaxID=200324 RepID=A0A2N5UKW7_9BASI|nr:hypothetical protein PCANC_13671 [Puccinia coronata f. sp. avenae]